MTAFLLYKCQCYDCRDRDYCQPVYQRENTVGFFSSIFSYNLCRAISLQKNGSRLNYAVAEITILFYCRPAAKPLTLVIFISGYIQRIARDIPIIAAAVHRFLIKNISFVLSEIRIVPVVQRQERIVIKSIGSVFVVP